MLYAAANDFSKPYLDSSVFFAVIKKESELCSSGLMRWQVAEHILRGAEQGRYQIYTSTITLAEVRRIRGKGVQLTQDELTTVARFFRHGYITLAAVTREIAERAQILGAQHGIWPMDAIHLATAIQLQCDVLLAWDKSFSSKFQDGPIEGVRVLEPY